MSASLGIVSLLRGDRLLTERWADALARIRPEGARVLATIPRTAPKQIPDGLDAEILPVDPFASRHAPGSFEHAADRCDYIAGLYSQVLPKLFTTVNSILFFEDDILPPDDGLSQLQSALAAALPSVAGIGSVYPLHGTPDAACLSIEEWGLPPKITDLGREPFPVFTGGTGFSLWRAADLATCLPIRRLEAVVDWDSALAIDLRKRGKEILCHGNVRCHHGR